MAFFFLNTLKIMTFLEVETSNYTLHIQFLSYGEGGDVRISDQLT